MKFPFLFLLAWGALSVGAWAQGPTPAAGKVPSLRVQPTVGTHQRTINAAASRKSMEITPKLTIEGTSGLLPVPHLEATMLIVTMETHARYTQGQTLYTINSKDTADIPAADGGRRQFDFPTSTVEFDANRDSSNSGGLVYKYFIFALRDPEAGTIVDFQTNFPALAALCRDHPERRAEFLDLAQGAKVPADVK